MFVKSLERLAGLALQAREAYRDTVGTVALAAGKALERDHAMERLLAVKGNTVHFLGRTAAEMVRGLPAAHEMVVRIKRGEPWTIPAHGRLDPLHEMPANGVLLELMSKIRGPWEEACGSREPHLVLLGPGHSKTDPLYAKWFLDQMGKPGALTVLEHDSHPNLPRYYDRLSFAPHHPNLIFGYEGNFVGVLEGNATMVLCLHPAGDFDSFHTLLMLFKNLRPGTVVVLQKDFAQVPKSEWKQALADATKLYSADFEILFATREGPIFTTPWAISFADCTHVVALRRRAD